MTTNAFGEQLKQWRKDKGLEQQEIATQSGLAQSVISELERGKSNLSRRQAREISSVLNLSTFDVYKQWVQEKVESKIKDLADRSDEISEPEAYRKILEQQMDRLATEFGNLLFMKKLLSDKDDHEEKDKIEEFINEQFDRLEKEIDGFETLKQDQIDNELLLNIL